MQTPDRAAIQTGFERIQDQICAGLEALDGGAHFQQDSWQHHAGGGGRSRVIQHGQLLAKGGVNFSAVRGEASPMLLKTLRLEPLADAPAAVEFHATGVSIVLHPHSPEVPIIHANIRYFELSDGRWWFGGGIDLTPHYVDRALARDFHTQLKGVCDRFHPSYYPEFKRWADDYFFLPHRGETRGIGGVFFDRLADNQDFTKAQRWDFVQAIGEAFVPLYAHQAEATRQRPYTETEQAWQRLRRGRYVEFNLVWDKGTQFGLQTNGRTESILMSLPPQADWAYQYQPLPDSREQQTLDLLRKGVDWTAG